VATDGGSASIRGYEFEREVASIFRTLGGRIEHNVALAGNQIDVLVREQTPSGTAVTTAVECKAFSRPVGVDVVNAFAGLALLLKQRGAIIDDLRQRVRGKVRPCPRPYYGSIVDLREKLERRLRAMLGSEGGGGR
jgi:hypothetical protein